MHIDLPFAMCIMRMYMCTYGVPVYVYTYTFQFVYLQVCKFINAYAYILKL